MSEPAIIAIFATACKKEHAPIRVMEFALRAPVALVLQKEHAPRGMMELALRAPVALVAQIVTACRFGLWLWGVHRQTAHVVVASLDMTRSEQNSVRIIVRHGALDLKPW